MLAGCAKVVKVTVTWPTAGECTEEMVELPADSIFRLLGFPERGRTVVVNGPDGEEIPYQLTHDGLLIFPVIGSRGEEGVAYTIQRGQPAPVDTLVCGRQYPERLDDISWENDLSGYRIYGPASLQAGNHLYGYDIFTKNVARPVLEERYALDLSPTYRAQIENLRELGLTDEADSLQRAISYHVDHGEGMDAYDVGPTLGGGGSAILTPDGELLYQKTYESFEVLDNGPLRFTVRLTYPPITVGHDSAVVETRVIQLDQGSYLNKTTVSLAGLTTPIDIVAGCVIHRQSPDTYLYSAYDGFISCADSTSNPRAGHGVVFVGLAFPSGVSNMRELAFSQPKGSAIGQVMALIPYSPGSQIVYYWGSGWSHAQVHDLTEWSTVMRLAADRLRQPLTVRIENL